MNSDWKNSRIANIVIKTFLLLGIFIFMEGYRASLAPVDFSTWLIWDSIGMVSVILLLYLKPKHPLFLFLFSKKKIIFFAVMYLLGVVVALSQAYAMKEVLKKEIAFKKCTVSYNYEHIFFTLRPQVVVYLSGVQKTETIYETAKALFNQPVGARLDYHDVYLKDGVQHAGTITRVRVYNYFNKVQDIGSLIIVGYLIFASSYFVFSGIFRFSTSLPFITRESNFHMKKKPLVVWLIILLFIEFLRLIVYDVSFPPDKEYNHKFPTFSDWEQEKGFGRSFQNKNIIKGVSDGL